MLISKTNLYAFYFCKVILKQQKYLKGNFFLSNLWQLTDRQLANTMIHRQCFFTDSRLTDTTTDQHDKSQTKFKKKIKNSPTHSQTLTDSYYSYKMNERKLFCQPQSQFICQSRKKLPRVGILFCFRHHFHVWSSRLSGKFHPRYFPVEFAGIFRPGKYAQSGKYGKYDFGLVIM